MTAERFDVIVVGAGFGGATCAALLAKRGLRVLLLEKNSQAGGKAMVISKNGFTYEMWPVIHAPARSSRCLQVLRELGVEDRVELAVPEVRGGIYFDAAGEVRRFPNDPDPDGTKILRLLGVAEDELPKAIQVLAEMALLPPAESAKLDEVSFTQWLEEKGAPAPVRMYLHALANGVFMVPSDVLPASEAIRTLQEIMLQHGGLYASSGGIGRLAEIYADTVEENGGRVVYRARVRAIEVEAGRVTGVRTDQGVFTAPIVVSNAGLQTTVLKLVGEQHFDKSYANWVRDLVPSWGMIGLRYFLDTELLDEPYALVFSEQAYWTSDRWLAHAGRRAAAARSDHVGAGAVAEQSGTRAAGQAVRAHREPGAHRIPTPPSPTRSAGGARSTRSWSAPGRASIRTSSRARPTTRATRVESRASRPSQASAASASGSAR